MDNFEPRACSSLRCEVCGEPIAHFRNFKREELEIPVCADRECRGFFTRNRSLPENLWRAKLEFQRRLIRERKLAQADKAHRIEARVLKEERENQALFHAALRERPEAQQEHAYRMILPAGRAGRAAMDSSRVENYREHLHKIVKLAEGVSEQSSLVDDQNFAPADKIKRREKRFLNNPELESVGDNLCSMCKGACCSSGQDHAYLSPLSMRRIMDVHPDLDGEAIVAMYVSRVASETIEKSCINHTENGCSLPKHLRSDICNAYFCDPLLKYQRECYRTEKQKTVIAIQREYVFAGTMDPDVSNDVIAVAVVTSEGVDPVG